MESKVTNLVALVLQEGGLKVNEISEQRAINIYVNSRAFTNEC